MANFLLLTCAVLQVISGSAVNIALRKPSSASAMERGYSASTAVDGNTVANSDDPSKIILTRSGQSSAWWKVDLQREVQDATVRIYFRTDYTGRRNGVTLYTSTSPFSGQFGQLCHTVRGAAHGRDINSSYSVTCPGRWSYLLLYTDTVNEGGLTGPILDFGEVEVFVLPCDDGYYGQNCDKLCSERKCKAPSASSCDRDGTCPDGCEDGWRQGDCTQECRSGSYGSGCSLSCTDRKCIDSPSPCNHVIGQCEGGCLTGYKGVDCRQECDFDFYGQDCNLSCTERKCLDSLSHCDHVTGQCECKPGYNGTDCRQNCASDFFGSGCNMSCTDRKCLVTSSSCDHVTGQCEGGCEAGFNGANCIEACTPGVTYGVNCEKSCSSRHCVTSSSVCDPQTGQCPEGCEPGWTGGDCSISCLSGRYGPDCREECGYCDGVCDRVNGLCYVGCLDGYSGAWCNVTGTTSSAINNTLVGAVIGSVLGTLLLVVGVLVFLIRQGRLQWVKDPGDKKERHGPHDNTQMSNIARQPVGVSEHAQSSSHVYNNDYAVLDPEKMPGNKDYDVIQHKEYQNI